MALTPAPKAYTPANIPVVPGGERVYLQLELRHISESINVLISAVKALDARLAAHGW